jgi:hypothetical protein
VDEVKVEFESDGEVALIDIKSSHIINSPHLRSTTPSHSPGSLRHSSDLSHLSHLRPLFYPPSLPHLARCLQCTQSGPYPSFQQGYVYHFLGRQPVRPLLLFSVSQSKSVPTACGPAVLSLRVVLAHHSACTKPSQCHPMVSHRPFCTPAPIPYIVLRT